MLLRALTVAVMCLLAVAIACTPALAEPHRIAPRVSSKPVELTASDGAADDYYGQSVAISGNTIVVGAPTEYGAGAAYVYTIPSNGSQTPTQTAELLPSNGSDGDGFGASVAISDDTVVVGAPGTAGGGAAYVYTLPASGTTEYQSRELQPSGAPLYARFGASVAVSGSEAVVGAPDLNVTPEGGTQNSSQGGVYTFALPGGSQTGLLTASDGAAYDNLGASVAIANGIVAAGAPGRQVGSNRIQGMVYVWSGGKVAELTAPNGYFKAALGSSLAMTSNTIVAGAPGAGSSPGDVYVYTMPQNGWASGITPADLTDGEFGTGGLGGSVAIDGSTIAAGAEGASSGQGAVFTYTEDLTNGWVSTSSVDGLQVFNGGAGFGLGSGVGLSSGTLVAGAWSGTVDSHTSQGAAWVWNLTPPLVVNSTANTPDAGSSLAADTCNTTPSSSTANCTLYAAIQTADQAGGGTITFDIPSGDGNAFDDGVPQISTADSLLPPLTSATTINGTTQPYANRVEISGIFDNGTTTEGLLVNSSAAGSILKGLVVNGFQEMIDLRGGDSTVEDDLLGTNVDGTAADPTPLSGGPRSPYGQLAIRIESSGNRIGVPGAANIISSGYVFDSSAQTPNPLNGAPEIDDTAGGNTIEDNTVGVSASGKPLIGTPEFRSNQSAPVSALATGPSDLVGGPGSGDGNTLAGGAIVDGESTLEGNTFTDGGLQSAAAAAGGGASFAPLLDASGRVTVGGPTATPGAGDGNRFSIVDGEFVGVELELDGSGATVQGNLLEGDPAGGIEDRGTDMTIGGTSSYGVENLIENNAQGSRATSAVAAGVITRTPADSHTLIEHNDFDDDGTAGAVDVDSGDGVTITENVMRKNAQGITLEHHYLEDGTSPPDTTDANDYQPYPLLFSTSEHDGHTGMTARLTEPATFAGDKFTIELYAMASCAGERAQGLQSLGEQTVTTILGSYDFALDFDAVPAGDTGITITATGPDGSTSEFGPCLTLGTKAKSFDLDGVIVPAGTVDVSSGSSPANDAVAATVKARGALPLSCPPITTGSCSGTATIITSAKHSTRIARIRFKLAAGATGSYAFTVPSTFFSKLKRSHRLRARVTILAHDSGKKRKHKRSTARITLAYVR